MTEPASPADKGLNGTHCSTRDTHQGVDIGIIAASIDSELSDIRSQRDRTGITHWVLLAALGSLLWLLATQLADIASTITATSVLKVFLFLVLVHDSALGLRSLLSRSPGGAPGGEVRYLLLRHQLPHRFTILIQAARFGLIYKLLSTCVDCQRLAAIKTAQGVYAAFAILLLVSLAITFVPLPIRTGGTRWAQLMSTVAAVGVEGALVWAAVALGHTLMVERLWAQQEPLRLALLLTAILLVVVRLATVGEESPLSASLIDLRRQLVTGRLTAAEGMQELDTILRGMRLRRVLQGDLARVLRLWEGYESNYAEAERLLDELEPLAKRLQDKNSIDKGQGGKEEPGASATVLGALWQALAARLDAGHANYSEAKTATDRFSGRLRYLVRTPESTGGDAELLSGRLLTTVDAAVRRTESVAKRLNELKQILGTEGKAGESVEAVRSS